MLFILTRTDARSDLFFSSFHQQLSFIIVTHPSPLLFSRVTLTIEILFWAMSSYASLSNPILGAFERSPRFVSLFLFLPHLLGPADFNILRDIPYPLLSLYLPSHVAHWRLQHVCFFEHRRFLLLCCVVVVVVEFRKAQLV